MCLVAISFIMINDGFADLIRSSPHEIVSGFGLIILNPPNLTSWGSHLKLEVNYTYSQLSNYFCVGTLDWNEILVPSRLRLIFGPLSTLMHKS